MATRLKDATALDDNSDMLQTHLPDSASDIFPFFDLPREMRDLIYIGIECKEINFPAELTQSHYKATIYEYPIISCLQVSKLFQSEYLDSLKGQLRLRLDDVGSAIFTPTLSVNLQHVAKCDMAILASDSSDIEAHSNSLGDITSSINQSCKVSIRLILDYDFHGQDDTSEERAAVARSLVTLVSLCRNSTFQAHHSIDGVEKFPVHAAHPSFAEAPIFEWAAGQGWCSAALDIFGDALRDAQPTASDGKAETN
ncbi:hypothetical protein Slin15195_G075080 [Septoria linicola]|uniref:Uncharacterized protein n=1 Tax=Septoria linicola TaxID=215465 RepID=A0A9Q9AT53_9PEZI|nr:hypothetical protein Slin15195_G075080 [Septoria linicola]